MNKKHIFDLKILDLVNNDKIFVKGILLHLINEFVSEYSQKTETSVFFAKQNNNNVRKFFSSIELLDIHDRFPTISALEYTLQDLYFERVLKVTQRTEWSRIGDLVSFWPIGYDHPIRISYFGDEVEFIEQYDEIYNTKLKSFNVIVLGNNSKLDNSTDWNLFDFKFFENSNKILFFIFEQRHGFDKAKYPENFSLVEYDYKYPQLFFRQFGELEKECKKLLDSNYDIFISTKHKDQIPVSLIKYTETREQFSNLDAGFVSQNSKIAVFTDRELFGTIFLESNKKQISSKQAKRILERLEGEIELNDYVVHEDHGIGIYQGITQEKTVQKDLIGFEWKEREIFDDYLKISYAETDELLVPISQIHKITKYIGTTEELPIITRLHKGSWQKTLQKVKKSIQLIARDLIKHYAQIQLTSIEYISKIDSEEYKTFVSKFLYDETQDQLTTIEDIKNDLSLNKPMNRLIVGDVGFGKTEVAMRAAFKIIETKKQVAVLCPTTVLAAQHFKVFYDRFKDFGIKTEYISRFNSSAENKRVIDRAKNGKIDILIGTHRLLSNDVKFKDLGLIIIDEEQKFGVKQKEKIRKLQYTAHSLFLTATPIPRTLSMALSEIKDISIISTPPVERKSVYTEVNKSNWSKIAEQIKFEFDRGGQSYFLHNDVATIFSIKSKLETLLPNIRFIVGHGQMNSKKLDESIRDFYEGKYDVLICTTIIENGIDMPNVNTIIINNAQNFGLGQLYQLRGRVGRSDKQAYCYLYYKGIEMENEESIQDDNFKTPKYIERLKAILESQELGSGFKIASRDLEIRGAGNLLGEQQHGNIKNIGLGLYMQMLAEEIERLKISNDNQSQSNTK